MTRRKVGWLCRGAVLVLVACLQSMAEAGEPLRAGIIGCDTSHVAVFSKAFNDDEGPLAGVRVVAAFPSFSDDIPASRDRVDGFTAGLRDRDVEIVDSVGALLDRVDVVLIENVDGRRHLEYAREVFATGKPTFIDKPIGGSLADAVEIFQLAAETGTPCFSSSSLRFMPRYREALGDPELGKVIGCQVHGPCVLEPHHPDLYWYGIHGIELLFSMMGPDCQSAARVQVADTEFVTGVWKGGRIGTFRGLRTGPRGFGATIFGASANKAVAGADGYDELIKQIALFFQTRQPPVTTDETLAIFAFMEAADTSLERGGCSVTLEEVLAAARSEVAKRRHLPATSTKNVTP